MTEHGVPDNRLNRKRTVGRSHPLPAGHKPTPDPRHNLTKARAEAAVEAAAEAAAEAEAFATRSPLPPKAAKPASVPTKAKHPAITGSQHRAGHTRP